MQSPNLADRNQAGAQTASRCIALLEFLAAAPEPLPLRDIADGLGLTRTAVYRLLAEFTKQGFLSKSSDHRYGAGPGLVAFAARIVGNAPLRQSTHDVLAAIVAETGETVALHVRTNGLRVCVDTVESSQPIRRVVPIGQTLPLYAGPTGKVILTFLPVRDQEAILKRAGADGLDVEAIRADLVKAREAGYAAAIGDRIAGVGGLSIALFGSGPAMAALTVSGPAERWGLEQIDEALPRVLQQCANLVGWSVAPSLVAHDEAKAAAAYA